MRKVILSLVIGIFLLVASGVFAGAEFSEEFQSFVEDIAEQRGINQSDITNISQVDFNDLPDQVNLTNIDQTSLGLFQVNIVNSSPVYVITMTDTVFKKTIETIDLKRSYLNFGYSGKMPDTGFLKTSTEVESSLEKGYVMIRPGNITGISTNLDVTKSAANAQIEVIIYKNGEALGFGNTLIADAEGVKTDYDIQSEGLGSFNAGDVVSVYVNATGNIDWGDVTTFIEITTSS